MSQIPLSKYFENKLEKYESHKILVYEDIGPFCSPKIIRTLDQLLLFRLKKFNFFYKGTEFTSIVIK